MDSNTTVYGESQFRKDLIDLLKNPNEFDDQTKFEIVSAAFGFAIMFHDAEINHLWPKSSNGKYLPILDQEMFICEAFQKGPSALLNMIINDLYIDIDILKGCLSSNKSVFIEHEYIFEQYRSVNNIYNLGLDDFLNSIRI